MKQYLLQKIAVVLLPLALALGFVQFAYAHDLSVTADVNVKGGVNLPAGAVAKGETKADVKMETKQQNEVTRSQTEIANRISVLTALMNRINGMERVSAETKTKLSASIQTTISSLGALRTKIASDDAATLKTDMLSITEGTRVYMLIVPELRIMAAADRAGMIADMFAGVDAKVQTRIADAKAAGKDVTVMTTAEADMNAKSADAKVQATAAINVVSGLTPDGGDKTKMAANEAALKSARASLKTAESDLKAAQKDFKVIVAALKANGEVKASASGETETH